MRVPPTNGALGAKLTSGGVRFRLFSAHAEKVHLCLFDSPGDAAPARRIELRRLAGDLWQAELEDARPGQLYGYQVDGPHQPKAGHRFNASKLLVDPWARAITGEPAADASLFGFLPVGWPSPLWRQHSSELTFSSHSSAAAMPKCVVVDPAFDWRGDEAPRTPWRDTVIYECHVKGMTRRHSRVDERLRGTYLGLAEPPVVEHLLGLGITAVQLLPVHQIAREHHLMERGLANYWGYSTLGFFAPHAGYATGGRGEQVTEFKEMVRRLHEAGIEVILDVAYNHTAEGDRLGPTLSLRGIDNRSYYRLPRRSPWRYIDVTGCGNTLACDQPVVRELILGSLRYWVEEMHVDGFCFSLAPALARDGVTGDFDPGAALVCEIEADPVLSEVKLISVPWDAGPGGYQLGTFPATWAEWNDRYRDAARRFWHGDGGAAELARRLAGSPDLFPGRPRSSVNFVTCHDGFTLRDLVGRDADPARGDRDRRNLLATVLLSRGVPMLLGGDEIGRTQKCDDNAYCQDSETSWLDWNLEAEDLELSDFVRRLVALRREFPGLSGEAPSEARFWLPDGRELDAAAGLEHGRRALAIFLPGAAEDGADLLLLLNGSDAGVDFTLPEAGGVWQELLETSGDPGGGSGSLHRAAPFSLRLSCRRAAGAP